MTRRIRTKQFTKESSCVQPQPSEARTATLCHTYAKPPLKTYHLPKAAQNFAGSLLRGTGQGFKLLFKLETSEKVKSRGCRSESGIDQSLPHRDFGLVFRILVQENCKTFPSASFDEKTRNYPRRRFLLALVFDSAEAEPRFG